MKSTLLLSLLIGFSTLASAQDSKVPLISDRPETKAQTFMVEGVHCEGCTSSITKNVCTPNKYADCFVAVIDPKAELGQIRITPKVGQIVDVKELRAQVEKSGYKLRRD